MSEKLKSNRFKVVNVVARVQFELKLLAKFVRVRGEAQKFATYIAGGARSKNPVWIFDHRPSVIEAAITVEKNMAINDVVNMPGHIVVMAKRDNEGIVNGYFINIYPVESVKGAGENIPTLFSVTRYNGSQDTAVTITAGQAHWAKIWIWEAHYGKHVTSVVAVTDERKNILIAYPDSEERTVVIGREIVRSSAQGNIPKTGSQKPARGGKVKVEPSLPTPEKVKVNVRPAKKSANRSGGRRTTTYKPKPVEVAKKAFTRRPSYNEPLTATIGELTRFAVTTGR